MDKIKFYVVSHKKLSSLNQNGYASFDGDNFPISYKENSPETVERELANYLQWGWAPREANIVYTEYEAELSTDDVIGMQHGGHLAINISNPRRIKLTEAMIQKANALLLQREADHINNQIAADKKRIEDRMRELAEIKSKLGLVE